MFARLFERIFKKKAKVAILGLDLSGKTALLYQLLTNRFIRPPPTFGFNKEIVEIYGMDLDITDVGGNEKLISLWRHYMNDVDGIIYVIDVCDEGRYERNYDTLQELCQYPETTKLPLLILLNKSDLITTEECSSQKITHFKEKLKMLKSKSEVCMISARTREGVEDAISWICYQFGSVSARKMVKNKRKANEAISEPQTLALSNDVEKYNYNDNLDDEISHETESGDFDPVDESGINFVESLKIIEKFFEEQFRKPQKFSSSNQLAFRETRPRTASGRMQQLIQRLSTFNPISEESKQSFGSKYTRHQNETEDPDEVSSPGEATYADPAAASFGSHLEQQVPPIGGVNSSPSINHKVSRNKISDSHTNIPAKRNLMTRLFASIRSRFSRA